MSRPFDVTLTASDRQIAHIRCALTSHIVLTIRTCRQWASHVPYSLQGSSQVWHCRVTPPVSFDMKWWKLGQESRAGRSNDEVA
ncbi:hypothetical protein PoB_000633300 [Plakobranchus ocellatus]|uniref:Uncharacterized protein n=1 Tax=Plakobranchus ocellatus TaxID=259542 RepID=A0AAV3YBK2_9GAST|nr:hypothetical protein PoB_000633300 [Plakobranchus ocellatus]